MARLARLASPTPHQRTAVAWAQRDPFPPPALPLAGFHGQALSGVAGLEVALATWCREQHGSPTRMTSTPSQNRHQRREERWIRMYLHGIGS